MAEKTSTFEFLPMERAWIRNSLIVQRNVLQRALNKEMSGSEIHQLRLREIQSVDSIIAKVS
jgi:hypothetical protein